MGVAYSPQQISVVSSIYHNRWFSIQILNDENALEITTRVKNTPRHSLQIFTDWLDESGLTAFINRFRIYSSPHGLGESLFDTGAGLQGALVQFPNLLDVHELRYSLLSDLPASDTLDVILTSMRQIFRQQAKVKVVEEQICYLCETRKRLEKHPAAHCIFILPVSIDENLISWIERNGFCLDRADGMIKLINGLGQKLAMSLQLVGCLVYDATTSSWDLAIAPTENTS